MDNRSRIAVEHEVIRRGARHEMGERDDGSSKQGNLDKKIALALDTPGERKTG